MFKKNEINESYVPCFENHTLFHYSHPSGALPTKSFIGVVYRRLNATIFFDLQHGCTSKKKKKKIVDSDSQTRHWISLLRQYR
ncbi:hypothetical protein PUN28_019306 [Cardiocondyla obscurior]|uniref:Uncharacterized protein n=1 Tax=Cardiocondyla obscurior TaxID=286306 RepID=A0AAW2EF72_9HYME